MLADFIGNRRAVEQLRELVATRRAQRTIVLAGPEGIGKTTLAWMLGLALNCDAPPEPGDFCGECDSCRRAVPAAQIDREVATALDARAAEVKTNPREAAPLRIALHPAVRYYPPDGDYLSLPQARAVIHQTHVMPDAGRTWALILGDLDQARWATQAALLKTLEEPPPGVALIALARNPLALLPTVRSRALVVRLAPVAAPELEAALAARGAGEGAALAARLAQGRPGRALRLDPAAYRQLRAEALALLAAGLDPKAHRGANSLFRLTESTRANKEKFESLLEILYSVLQDIVYLQAGLSDAIRNVDVVPDLRRLSTSLSPAGIGEAVEALDRVQAAARRNVFRPLALASWSLGLASGGTGALHHG